MLLTTLHVTILFLVVDSSNAKCKKMETEIEKKQKNLSNSFKQKCGKTGDNLAARSII
jgi:predicted Holliday junction resolvase-like endonuclease